MFLSTFSLQNTTEITSKKYTMKLFRYNLLFVSLLLLSLSLSSSLSLAQEVSPIPRQYNEKQSLTEARMNRIILEGRKRTPQGDRGTAKKGITSVSTRGQQRRHLESKSNTAKSVKSPKNSKSAKPGKNSKGGIITTNRRL